MLFGCGFFSLLWQSKFLSLILLAVRDLVTDYIMIKFRFLISLLHEDEVFQNNVDDEIQDDITVTYTKKKQTNKQTKKDKDSYLFNLLEQSEVSFPY